MRQQSSLSWRLARHSATVVAVATMFLRFPDHLRAQVVPPAGPQDESVITLSPFSVEAKEDKSGYGVTSATSVTRLNTPLREIPQTINIVTEKFIKELAAPTLGEAVAFMPNVTNRTGAPDRFQVRSIDTFSSFRNGFRYNTGDSMNFVKDLSNVERIEIIKGLGSATTGRGEAGGVINLITKKPQVRSATSIKGLVDQFGYYKTELDTTGAANRKETVLYRFIAAYAGGDIYAPNEKYNTISFYPSVELRLSDRTNLLIEGSLQSGQTPGAEFFEVNDGRIDFRRDANGVIVAPVLPPINSLTIVRNVSLRHLQTLPWIKPDAQDYELMASLNHKFSSWFSTRQALLYVKTEVDREFTRLRGQISGEPGWVFAPSDTAKLHPIDFLYAWRYTMQEADRKILSYQGDYLFEVETRGIKNQTLLGMEHTSRKVLSRNSQYDSGSKGVRVIDQTDYLKIKRSDVPTPTVQAYTHDDTTETSFYVQHTVKVLRDKLQLLGGWRYDKIEQDILNLRNNQLTKSRPTPTDKTWRIGTTYEILPKINLYAVHAEQQDPLQTVLRFPSGTGGVAGRDPNELISAARTVELDELGLKSELFDGRVTFNLTWYDISEGSNLRTHNFRTSSTDQQDPRYNWTETVIDPNGISRGWEIEIVGAPTDRLSLYGSASFPTNETLQAIQGNGLVTTSFRRGHSDARLNFAGNYLTLSKQGYKVYAQTAFGWVDDVVLNPDNRILQKGSLRWDMGVRVVRGTDSGGWEAQIRVQNVLDQRIVTGTGNAGTSPRRWSFSLERRF